MEHLSIHLNDDDFDRIVHQGLPEFGDVKIAVKLKATAGDRAGIAIGWTAVLPDGSTTPVQAVLTARLFLSAANAVKAYLERNGEPQ